MQRTLAVATDEPVEEQHQEVSGRAASRGEGTSRMPVPRSTRSACDEPASVDQTRTSGLGRAPHRSLLSQVHRTDRVVRLAIQRAEQLASASVENLAVVRDNDAPYVQLHVVAWAQAEDVVGSIRANVRTSEGRWSALRTRGGDFGVAYATFETEHALPSQWRATSRPNAWSHEARSALARARVQPWAGNAESEIVSALGRH